MTIRSARIFCTIVEKSRIPAGMRAQSARRCVYDAREDGCVCNFRGQYFIFRARNEAYSADREVAGMALGPAVGGVLADQALTGCAQRRAT